MQKPSQFTQELKFNLKSNISDTLVTVQKSSTCMVIDIDSQVCFHKWDPVKLCWGITGPVEPLGSTNQSLWDAKLLPMSVSTYPVDCVHLCHLLRTQYHCLCPNGGENLPLACPPTHPLIHDIRDVTGIAKTTSKTSSEYCTAELAMKH